MLTLCVLGVLISGYLSVNRWLGTSTACIGGSSSCTLVQNSAFAQLAGVPIPYLGLITYVGLLVLLVGKTSDWRQMGQVAAQLFLGLTIIGALFSAYLTYIELFVINDI